ncbi:MAG: sulfite exporter TauE/SafE family protein [Alphaproteobacteria bacterium]|nr:sulfite exporter TauE/SafE family protein [Alphaproteobacteria bacterium]
MEQTFLLSEVSLASFVLIGVVALAASIMGGIGGGGLGLMIVPLLAPIVGIKAVIPLMAVSGLLSNSSRVFAFRKHIDFPATMRFMLPAIPGVVLGAAIYSYLPAQALYGLLGAFLIISVPMRRYMESQRLQIKPKSVGWVGACYGVFAGSLNGTGAIVIATLLAAGLQGSTLVAGKAVVAVATTGIKIIMFGSLDILNAELALAGLLMGICMMPGAFIARWIVTRMDIRAHTKFIEIVILFGGCSLLWQVFA